MNKCSIKRKAGVALASVLVGALGASAIGAAPASADHVACPSGNACIWAGTGFQSDGDHDRWVQFSQYIPNYDLWYYGQQTGGQSSYTAYRNASSVSNRGNFDTAYFYTGTNASGTRFAWARQTGDQDLSNGPSGSNNAFASGYFASYAP